VLLFTLKIETSKELSGYALKTNLIVTFSGSYGKAG